MKKKIHSEKSKKEKKATVCVIGLGYVGLTLAVVFAEEGARVIGVDMNGTIIDNLLNRIPHFYEPGLEEKLRLNSKNLTFSTSIPILPAGSTYVVAVGSSVSAGGVPDYSQVEQSSREIGAVLKKGDQVVLRSTVTIGTTRERVIPILESISGMKAGKDFFVIFAPERTIEGKAIVELRTLPQVIGGYTAKCLQKGIKLFSCFAPRVVPVETLEEAEMTKLISNAYRDLVFAFANSLALISSEYNVNVNKVINAANEGYKRNSIPLPSPGVGGYCLTKDPLLLAHGSKSALNVGQIFREGRRINGVMPSHVAHIVSGFAEECLQGSIAPHVVIVGLAFKGSPATSDVRFSPSYTLVQELRSLGYTHISGFDGHVSPEVFEDWKIGHLESMDDVLKYADIVVLMHLNSEYEKCDYSTLWKQSKGKKKLLLDPWGMLDVEREKFKKKNISYANLGLRAF